MPQLKSNMKFYRNPSCGNRVDLCGQAERRWRSDGRTDWWTGRHDEASSRVSQFCERVHKRHEGGILVWCSYVLFFLPIFPSSIFRNFVFSASSFVKFFVLTLLFLSYPTSSFFLTSPLPNITFLKISLYSHFSFHFSSKYQSAKGTTNDISCPKSENILLLAVSNNGTTKLEGLTAVLPNTQVFWNVTLYRFVNS